MMQMMGRQAVDMSDEEEAQQISSSSEEEQEDRSGDDGELNDSRESSVDKVSLETNEEEKSSGKSEKSKEEGELEEGEITDSDGDEDLQQHLAQKFNNERPRIFALPIDGDEDSKSATRIVGVSSTVDSNAGVCRFFARGTCTWGENCKYKHVKDSSELRNNRFPATTNRHSVFVGNTSPVPLNSLSTFLPQNEWERAVKLRKHSPNVLKREVDGDQKYKRKRRRSGSSSSRESRKSPNYEPMTKKIPSLLDLSPTAMGRNSGSARRDSGGPINNRRSSSSRYVERASRSPSDHSHRQKRNSGSTTSSRHVKRDDHGKRNRDKSPTKLRRQVEPPKRSSKREHKSRHSKKEKSRRSRSSSTNSSISPIGFRTKNPTKQQIEDYFAERDDEKPAAYRRDGGSSDTERRHRKTRTFSTSSSSSASTSTNESTSRSSSASSRSSTHSVKRHKSSKRHIKSKLPDAQAISNSDSDTAKAKTKGRSKDKGKSKKFEKAEQISSDDEESTSNLKPQQISDNSGDEDEKREEDEPEQISSEDDEEKEQKGKKRRKRSFSLSENNSDNESSDSQKQKKHKRRRTKKSPSSVSERSGSGDRALSSGSIDEERQHEDAILNMDIGEVLEQYESRNGRDTQSPVNVA